MNKIFTNANVSAMASGLSLVENPEAISIVVQKDPSSFHRSSEFLEFTKKAFQMMVDSEVPVLSSVEVSEFPVEGNNGDWFLWWHKTRQPIVCLSPTFYITKRVSRSNKHIRWDRAAHNAFSGINGYAPSIRAVWYEFDVDGKLVKSFKDLVKDEAADFQRGTLLLRGKLK